MVEMNLRAGSGLALKLMKLGSAEVKEAALMLPSIQAGCPKCRLE